MGRGVGLLDAIRKSAQLQNRDRVSRRTCGADDRQRREQIGEDPGLALDQPLERHAFMEMDSIFHDEVLMAGMENLGIDRRHHLNGEIVRPTTQT